MFFDQYLTAKETAAYLRISVASLNRYRQLAGFPSPVHPTKRRILWRRESLDAFLACGGVEALLGLSDAQNENPASGIASSILDEEEASHDA